MNISRFSAGLLLAIAGTLAWASVPPETPSTDRVHPLVLAQADAGPVEFNIWLAEQADLGPVEQLTTKAEKGSRVFELLTEVASRTQAPLIEMLEARGLEYRPFWIANTIWVRGGLDDVLAIASRPDVLRVDANPQVDLQAPLPVDEPTPTSLEWGLIKVLADQVWALGYTGEGIVIAGQDTGYDWDHPAIKQKYRGWDGVSADHDYNWHDSIHAGGGVCGPDSPQPCDDHSHGTHTMGTMVGDDGGSNQIGVAPGATWIGCRNMNQGNGTPATYTECFQWLVAPTDLDDLNPDPAKAPHVINNSWLCPPSEGCSWDSLQTVVENTRAAGIVVVASAGNDGGSCESINSPPAIYDAAFSVGATNSSDQIASFSSRGPVSVDGSNRLKPDVSAPGVSVRSCVPGGGYSSKSGTSMAGPHVAGVVALVLDARPDLIGNVEEVEELLRLSADPKTSTQDCGDYPGSDVPNAVFGFGRINALAAIVGDADGDGVENLEDCSPGDGTAWAPPGSVVDLTVDMNSLGNILTWSAPPDAGGSLLEYDLLRSGDPGDFSGGDCLASDLYATVGTETEIPETIFYYLVRAMNACGTNLGADSVGTPRTARTCP